MSAFKRMFFFVLVAASFFTITTAAYAEPFSFKPPPGTDKAYKEAGIDSLQYLQDWGCSLISSGGGYINLTDFTQAYQDVDYIMVRLYLQRWNGSNWVDLASWPFQKSYNSSVNGVISLQVARGYYYRVWAYHSLANNGANECAYSYSSSLFIN
ncbi:DUF6147 family protein [Pelotomaculum terephthalicicum JT]|uniref:DUF6147 family protein n=1 Tax=Pelotomaculum TaxID=191373 RepID=UPI0009CDC2B0|nr:MULTISPECIES: DUF6147 family protein [Pelotomaculum]MCG9969538.1 DUF6147 family protein [Pelotomaculum terephthalicicum JT]OPX86122.1 MAG: hypothetical protein A4E54_02046 [Pelotomaculum sp. PtaB.Bin117]OPY59547.1 MAG: hypothetical protein A4E55_00165 [Pelotomaculum sp. PtaU1.Bin035]